MVLFYARTARTRVYILFHPLVFAVISQRTKTPTMKVQNAVPFMNYTTRYFRSSQLLSHSPLRPPAYPTLSEAGDHSGSHGRFPAYQYTVGTYFGEFPTIAFSE